MSSPAGLAIPRFCVCGEWFDQALAASHCARLKTEPLPALPYGDFGTVWPAPKRFDHPAYGYSEFLPKLPGHFVYRLWGRYQISTPNGCLYVGMVGEKGPRLLAARLDEHRRTKDWWPLVARIDATECDPLDAGKEEAIQIAHLTPEHNRRTEGHRLTAAESGAAQGWPSYAGDW